MNQGKKNGPMEDYGKPLLLQVSWSYPNELGPKISFVIAARRQASQSLPTYIWPQLYTTCHVSNFSDYNLDIKLAPWIERLRCFNGHYHAFNICKYFPGTTRSPAAFNSLSSWLTTLLCLLHDTILHWAFFFSCHSHVWDQNDQFVQML